MQCTKYFLFILKCRLDAPCCLTAVRFHPRDPSLVAAGGFTGELFLWSAAKDSSSAVDALLASSNMQGHREKVTSVQWLPRGESQRADLLLSSALDGRMFLWAVESKAQALLPTRAFMIMAEHLPRSLKVKFIVSSELVFASGNFSSSSPLHAFLLRN